MENELKKLAATIAMLHVDSAKLYKSYENSENYRKQLIELNKHVLTPADYALAEKYSKEDQEILNQRVSIIDSELATVPKLLAEFPDLKKYLDLYMPRC